MNAELHNRIPWTIIITLSLEEPGRDSVSLACVDKAVAFRQRK